MLSQVIADAKLGDRHAVGLLYRNHVGIVWGYFRACGISDSEDLTSDVFVGMLRNLRSFSGDPEQFRTWLMSIAYRRMVDTRRRQGLRSIDLRDPQDIEFTEVPDSPDFSTIEIDPNLLSALADLTDAQREVLALRFIADLGLERVAEVTGRPVGAVKSLQHRGLATLRTRLNDASVDSAALSK